MCELMASRKSLKRNSARLVVKNTPFSYLFLKDIWFRERERERENYISFSLYKEWWYQCKYEYNQITSEFKIKFPEEHIAIHFPGIATSPSSRTPRLQPTCCLTPGPNAYNLIRRQTERSDRSTVIADGYRWKRGHVSSALFNSHFLTSPLAIKVPATALRPHQHRLIV